MKVLIADTETTGLDKELDSVIEIGAVLIETSSRSIISCYSSLLHEPENRGVDINKIPQAALDDPLARDRQVALDPFIYLLGKADVVMAHNSEFDRRMIEKLLEREFGGTIPEELVKPWVCSMTQFRYPEYPKEFPGKFKKLSHVAIDHGIVPGKLHRALPDALLVAELVLKLDNLEEQVRRAMGVRVVYAVYPPSPPERPTDYGFHWNHEKRRWQRLMNTAEASELPFQAERTEDRG
jgi:DNA polymerase III epsilon subunit-like protein